MAPASGVANKMHLLSVVGGGGGGAKTEKMPKTIVEEKIVLAQFSTKLQNFCRLT